jgi:hypothetical protein
MITRDHHNQTEFLKRCLRYGEGAGCQQLLLEMTRLQRDARSVWRAAALMAVLFVLALTVLAYATILLDNFPYNTPHFIASLSCAVGAGSLISLLAFLGLGILYRRRLDYRREESRQLIAKLLESRLGCPSAASPPGTLLSDPARAPVPAADGAALSPASNPAPDLNLKLNLNF